MMPAPAVPGPRPIQPKPNPHRPQQPPPGPDFRPGGLGMDVDSDYDAPLHGFQGGFAEAMFGILHPVNT